MEGIREGGDLGFRRTWNDAVVGKNKHGNGVVLVPFQAFKRRCFQAYQGRRLGVVQDAVHVPWRHAAGAVQGATLASFLMPFRRH